MPPDIGYYYEVSSQHRNVGTPFISPVSIMAESPREAAQIRLEQMVRDSQESTCALLVVGNERSYVFPVQPPVGATVAETALVMG